MFDKVSTHNQTIINNNDGECSMGTKHKLQSSHVDFTKSEGQIFVKLCRETSSKEIRRKHLQNFEDISNTSEFENCFNYINIITSINF